MKTNVHFWSYLAHLFVEWEMFHTKVVEKNIPIFYVKNEKKKYAWCLPLSITTSYVQYIEDIAHILNFGVLKQA